MGTRETIVYDCEPCLVAVREVKDWGREVLSVTARCCETIFKELQSRRLDVWHEEVALRGFRALSTRKLGVCSRCFWKTSSGMPSPTPSMLKKNSHCNGRGVCAEEAGTYSVRI